MQTQKWLMEAEAFTHSSLEVGGTTHHAGPHGEAPGPVRGKYGQ